MTTMTTMLDHALAYLERGWSIMPVCWAVGGQCACGAGERHTDRPAKAPLVSWAELQKAPPTRDDIRRWWRRWPHANIGLVTGAVSGVVVLDLDTYAAQEHIEAVYPGTLNLMPTARTSNGLHFYFDHPGVRVRNRGEGDLPIPGVHFRGDGGYVVLPPSVHVSGAVYEWLSSPNEAEPSQLTDWLLEACREPERVSAVTPVVVPVNGTSEYAESAFKDEVREVSRAPAGARNNTLNRAAYSLAGFVATGELDGETVKNTLFEAAQAAGLTNQEAWRTIQSGYRAGLGAARTEHVDGSRDNGSTKGPRPAMGKPKKTKERDSTKSSELPCGPGKTKADRRPAVDIILDHATGMLEGTRGPRFIWRDRGKAYDERGKRLISRTEWRELHTHDVLAILLTDASELSRSCKIKDGGKREKKALETWKTWAPVAFQHMLGRLPDKEVAEGVGSNEEAALSYRSLKESVIDFLTRQVQMPVADSAHLKVSTTFLAEMNKTGATAWDQIATFGVWVRKDGRVAIRTEELRRATRNLQGLGIKAITRRMREYKIADPDTKKIMAGNLSINVLVVSKAWVAENLGIGKSDCA